MTANTTELDTAAKVLAFAFPPNPQPKDKMTPKFIKLTDSQGNGHILVNSCAITYCRSYNPKTTYVYQNGAIHEVTETPSEILALIEKP